MNILKNSILGGMAIGLGCIAYVSVENKYLGALLFSIGLLTICSRQWGLFTGKLCKSNNIRDIVSTWVLNLVGIVVMVCAYMLSVNDYSAVEKIATLKLNRPLLDVLFSGFLCEICIYIAVMGFFAYNISCVVKLTLAVMIFILCGFEHCVADMFYIWFSPLTLHTLLFILTVTCGNILGAVCMRVLEYKHEQEIQDS